MEETNTATNNTETLSRSEAMKRAWARRRKEGTATRRRASATAATKVTKAKGKVARRGRPALAAAPFSLSRAIYTLEQVNELGLLAVTTNGNEFRLIKTESGVVRVGAVRLA